MIQLKSGTLEERIIKTVQTNYPITTDELAIKLKISIKTAELALKRLQTKGLITLDILPDKVFIRLVETNLQFLGRKETQRKAIKRTGPKKKTVQDYEGMMYR